MSQLSRRWTFKRKGVGFPRGNFCPYLLFSFETGGVLRVPLFFFVQTESSARPAPLTLATREAPSRDRATDEARVHAASTGDGTHQFGDPESGVERHDTCVGVLARVRKKNADVERAP